MFALLVHLVLLGRSISIESISILDLYYTTCSWWFYPLCKKYASIRKSPSARREQKNFESTIQYQFPSIPGVFHREVIQPGTLPWERAVPLQYAPEKYHKGSQWLPQQDVTVFPRASIQSMPRFARKSWQQKIG